MARGTRATLKAEVVKLLQELGRTAEAVAKELEAEGVTGVPGSSTGCAIARYLHAVAGADSRLDSINVYHDYITIGWHWAKPPLVLAVPSPISAFMTEFDEGAFGRLIAAPGTAELGGRM